MKYPGFYDVTLMLRNTTYERDVRDMTMPHVVYMFVNSAMGSQGIFFIGLATYWPSGVIVIILLRIVKF